ncbi:MAG: TonB-dependent receptor [Planctomycetes bacterium]|nr:TonB-dependent receptor [Planctomycetota bacterium]
MFSRSTRSNKKRDPNPITGIAFFIALLSSEISSAEVAWPRESHELPDTVVTATRTESAIRESPAAVQVVDRERIDQSGAYTIGEVIEETAGMDVSAEEFSSVGSPTGVSIQGIDASRVLILVDGMRIIGDRAGVTNLAEIPLYSVERIEIVRGPSSVLYGSDALGGVVNIITRRPRNEIEGRVEADYRENEAYRGAARVSGLEGVFEYSASAGYFHRDKFDLDRSDPDTNGDEIYQRNGSAGFAWTPSDNARVEIEGGWFEESSKGIASQTNLGTTFLFDTPKDTRRIDGSFSGDFDLAEDTRLRARVYSSSFSRDTAKALRGAPTNDERNSIAGIRAAELQVDQGFELAGCTHTVTAGGEWRRETLSQDVLKTSVVGALTKAREIPGRGFALWAVFMHDEIEFSDDFKTSVGARMEHDTAFGLHVTESVSALFSPYSNFRMRASVATGFRSPDLKERYFDFDHSFLGYRVRGNANLDPERTLGVNVGFEFEPQDEIALSVNFYRNNLSDLIDSQLDPAESAASGLQIFSYQNIESLYTEGAEFQATFEPIPELTFSLSYDYLIAKNRSTGNALAARPAHKGTARVTYRIPGAGIELTSAARAKSSAFVDSSEQSRSRGYAIVDFRASFEIAKGFELFLGAENIANLTRDPKVATDLRPSSPREVYGGLSYEF